MTNGKDRQNEQIESLFRKACLPEPSPELKERIVAETTRAWNENSAELSWRIPLIRLIASAAAAVFIIWLASFTSDYSLARWQFTETSAMDQQSSELDVLPDSPYGPFVKHLTPANRKLPASDTFGLYHYVEMVRRLLDEASQNDVSNPPDPINGRSRLLPDRSSSSSYS